VSENLVTLKQAAERLGVSYSFLFRFYRRGVLPVVKLSPRCIRVKESDIELLLNARRIAEAINVATQDARAERTKRAKALGLLTADDFCDGASEQA